MSNGSGSGQSAPAGNTPPTLTFFTTGDPRPTPNVTGRNAPHLTNTQRWKRRAENLASQGRVHGVADVEAATIVLKALPADLKLRRIFFVGHGFNEGYFFHGKPDPDDPDHGFIADSFKESFAHPDDVQDANIKKMMKAFAEELAKHVHDSEKVEIGFLACFCGNGKMIRAICDELNKQKHPDFVVGAYENFYNANFIFSTATGKILHWEDFISNFETGEELDRADANQIPTYEVTCRNRVEIDPNDPLGNL
jgi:hypothetical protein